MHQRQMLLDWLGAEGQRRLRDAHALVVGCGALGGVIIEWLARALDDMDGIAPGSDPVHAAPTLDATLRQRVRAFQRAQGLKADGQPGPLTFMQLESAAATEQPRLQTEPR